MAPNGLSDKQAQKFAKRLSFGEKLREEAAKTPVAKGYSSILVEMENEFKDALDKKDYLRLFDLETVCQKHDAEYLKIDNIKSVKCLANLKTLKKIFIAGQNPEKVRQEYQPTLEDLKAYGTRVKDAIFETSTRSITRIIGSCVGTRSSFEEKSFYETRQNSLLAIKQEHQRNLDRAFGFDKTKERKRENDRGLSR